MDEGDTGEDHEPDHSDEPTHDHEHDDHHAHDIEELHFGVVTISSSREIEDDHAGDRAIELLEAADHVVETRELIRDEYDGIQSTVDRLANQEAIDCIITMGGTGVTPDDVTIEAVRPLFDKELPGFGELFRMLSYDEIGSRVVATRATAGIVDGVPVFSLPGSENATALGTADIVLEEAPHLAGLAPECQVEPSESDEDTENDDDGAEPEETDTEGEDEETEIEGSSNDESREKSG